MPFRHFYLLSHYICNGLLFLFSVCWLHVNEFNSFWEELRGRSQKTTATQKVCLLGIFTCSHITVAMVYSFYFLCVGSTWNEQNRLYWNKPQPSVPFPISLPKDYWIHSFWSQNTEKRNNTISQMRLRSVFKMRMSILNTATTEQMGYGIISFFVCFL